MADHNTGVVVLELRDAFDQFISDELELRFRNLRAQSLDFKTNVALHGVPLRLEGVIAFPEGNWRLEIFPKKYRFKSVFVDVPSNGEWVVKQTFFVDPSKVKPIFPTAEEIASGARWSALAKVLKDSTTQYASLDNEQKAGLLNLFAKMMHPSTEKSWDDVVGIFGFKPARIYARVNNQLWDKVRFLPQRFQEKPGTMHSFDDKWTRLAEHASFKTPDPMGNLQLIFANNAAGEMAVDADLDDHQGLKHAFDVIRHKFSGDTNPYDIHQVLVKFQKIDPGYRFA